MNFNPFELAKQMGNLETRMKKMKEEISSIKATGYSGAGMVEITINGEYQVSSININESIIDKDDKTTLEVLLISAFNDATNKIKQATEEFAKNQASMMGLIK